MQVHGRQLFWWRSLSLTLFLGLGGIVGCYSEEMDESTRKVNKMTEVFDTEEKYLGVPLKIDQIDFPGAGGVAGATIYKLKVFLRGPKGIAATPGNPKAPKGMPGTGAIGRGYEKEITAALNAGKPPLTPDSSDPPFGIVFMLDANASKTVNKGPRVETILAMFRPEVLSTGTAKTEGTQEKKGKNKLISDLARFGISKNFDPSVPENKDKFFLNKKLEPVFKDYMTGHSKAIQAEELITDSVQPLPDGRSQVWFTYLVPVDQKMGASTFKGTMALSYRVTWLGKQAAGAATPPPAKGAAGKTKSGKEGEVVFDAAKRAFVPPEQVKHSIATLRLGADVEKALELYNFRNGGGGGGGGSSSEATTPAPANSGQNTKSK